MREKPVYWRAKPVEGHDNRHMPCLQAVLAGRAGAKKRVELALSQQMVIPIIRAGNWEVICWSGPV